MARRDLSLAKTSLGPIPTSSGLRFEAVGFRKPRARPEAPQSGLSEGAGHVVVRACSFHSLVGFNSIFSDLLNNQAAQAAAEKALALANPVLDVTVPAVQAVKEKGRHLNERIYGRVWQNVA